MSRFIAPLALIVTLLCAAPATAGLVPDLYGGQTKLGTATSSRSAKGACSITPVVTDLVLRCDGTGTAQARYLFTIPKTAGSVMWQVNFDGTHSGAKVTTKRISDTQYRVTVTQAALGRAEVQSVMIEYYYGV